MLINLAKRLILAAAGCIVTSACLALPSTTKPSLINMLVTPCAANTLIIGNGATAAPLCGPTLGTGVATALGDNVGSAGSFVVNGGALGTPSGGAIGAGVTLGGVTMGLGSDATGDIYYRNSSGTLTRLGIGSSGNVLAIASGLPAWSPPTGGGNVSNTGTPTAGQFAQWTNATTIQGVTINNQSTTGPTTQIFLSGSGTYTTPAGVLWIEIRGTGGGSGGAGGGSSTSAGQGTVGGNTCWNTTGAACTSPVYEAGGGVATILNGPTTGGTISGAGTPIQSFAGGNGQGGGQTNASGGYPSGGQGGASCNGGAGAGAGAATAALAAAANSGSGGGGGGSSTGAASINMGSGGGAGACFYAIINSVAASYTYAVGAGGTSGAAGTSGTAGGNGANGGLWVIEHYTR